MGLIVRFLMASCVLMSAGAVIAEEPAADLLTGWTVENGCEVEQTAEGLLLKAGNGWIRSHLEYADFTMVVEWKALKEAQYDAGIYIRAAKEGAPFPKPAWQINLLDGKEGNIGNLPGASSTGLIRKGDWNRFEIRVEGEKVALKINGQPAYDVGGLTRPKGYVGIQVEVPIGGQFLLRKLEVSELGFEPLFNGKDLTGWEPAEADPNSIWFVEAGLLRCSGAKGPWLRSMKEYGDFSFRIDYKLSAGGNSGVYVRVPADGNHHREDDTQPAAGFEVQMLDDADPKYATLKDYQYSASVYDICGADPRVSRPAGEWNTLEIDCKGNRVTTVHNGVVVTKVTPETHPLILLRSVKGYLGLQNHSSDCAFRNVRIGPSLQSDAE